MVSIDQAIESCTWVFQRTHYWTAKIQDGGDPPSWKLTWHHFSAVGDPMWMKFGRLMDNHMLTAVIWSTSKPEVEFQCSGRLFFQTGNSYISAVDWVITMKFGLLTDTDLLKTASSPNPKPEVKLRRSGRHLENRYNITSALRMDRIRKPNAEWHAVYGDMVKIETRSRISIWRTVVFPNRK